MRPKQRMGDLYGCRVLCSLEIKFKFYISLDIFLRTALLYLLVSVFPTYIRLLGWYFVSCLVVKDSQVKFRACILFRVNWGPISISHYFVGNGGFVGVLIYILFSHLYVSVGWINRQTLTWLYFCLVIIS